MEQITNCIVCDNKLTQIQLWYRKRYCSKICFHKAQRGRATWNKGKKDYLSDEARKAMAENAKRNIAKETPEQRKSRMASVIEARNKNGNWTPPKLGKIAEQDSQWLGEKATYNAKHRWVQKHWEKNDVCDICGVVPISKGRNKHATHWHNISGEYKRIKEDWMELCPSCHKKEHIRLRNFK